MKACVLWDLKQLIENQRTQPKARIQVRKELDRGYQTGDLVWGSGLQPLETIPRRHSEVCGVGLVSQ